MWRRLAHSDVTLTGIQEEPEQEIPAGDHEVPPDVPPQEPPANDDETLYHPSREGLP